MDENLLFTAETLTLSPDLKLGQNVKGSFVVKNVTAQTYLTVDRLQWNVLCEFAEPQTVPYVLEKVIRERSCPALGDFYELILKAYRAGILRNEQSQGHRRVAVRWFVSLPARILLPASSLVLLAAIVFVAWRPLSVYGGWLDLVWGWLAICLALSAGNALAASALKSSEECEIYQPHIRWQTFVPHLELDLRDACLETPIMRLAIATARIAPLAGVVVAAVVLRHPWGLLPLLALFCELRPLGHGLIGQALPLLRRQPPLDTERDYLFRLNYRPIACLRAVWRHLEWRVTLVQLIYGAAWAFLVGYAALTLVSPSLRSIVTDWAYWRKTILWVIGGAGLISLVWLILGFRRPFYESVDAFRQRWRQRWRRWRSGPEAHNAEEAINRLFTENPLLRRLDVHARSEFAKALKPYSAKAFRCLVSFDEEPSFVGLIVSGTATVYRRTKAGRKTPLLRLVEGDFFGIHGLVDRYNRRLEVRSSSPIFALAIPTAEFHALVVEKLGEETVFNLTQKYAFLKRLPLCSEWRPQALVRFAQISQFASYAPGDRIITNGAVPMGFYVVYEGAARILHGCRQIGKVKAADFLGEIGLLQNSTTNADVEAREDTRCLVVNKVDFMRFMTHNYHVALQLERVSSKRLGYPIFPLSAHSFETR